MKQKARLSRTTPALLTGTLLLLIGIGLSLGCSAGDRDRSPLDYCAAQAERTLKELPPNQGPKNIPADSSAWVTTSSLDWVAGFWPGILWYLYEYTGDGQWKAAADAHTMRLAPLATRKAGNHDLGFQMFCSFGNAYRLTQDGKYKPYLLNAADTLATLYNPRVGTILSWPSQQKVWPHNTIIDNMLNLELLFWASKNGGRQELYDMAVSHARKTMQYQFRDDYSTCHVVEYNPETGAFVGQYTHQGYADGSLWARGQAWAVYGFTMTYRETRLPEFLETARKAYDTYRKRLPADYVPYWDFDAPGLPDEPRDASAAAVMASALIELSQLTDDPTWGDSYLDDAKKMLESLGSPAYRSGDAKPSFLLHSTGHYPKGSEIDAAIIYADYYYIEALMRLKKLEETGSIYD